MSAPKHTRGPWTLSAHTADMGVWVYGPYGPNNPRIAQVRFGLRCMEDAEIFAAEQANARLIAAAPDYAAAARKMIDALGYAPDEVIAGAFGDDVLHALNDLRAADRKATGESAS